ncbi:MAG: tape measure protein [Oscillospiraceae bacterium]|jgi:tape measure domain-containing protein|nr:tape measure protein [Oscillospiraceae bacterium]
MPNESLNIYLTAIDKASPVLASITDKTKALNKESQQLQQTYDALQKANRSLIERKTELQRKLQEVNEEVKAARKSFQTLGDEASSSAYEKAQEKQQKLRNEIAATTKALGENQKMYKENIEIIRKEELSGKEGFPLSAFIKGLGLDKQLGALAQSATSAVLSSGLGTDMGGMISGVLGSAVSGGLAGAAIFGVPGAAIGAMVSGVTSLMSGAIEQWTNKDDAFKDYYGGLYEDVKGRSGEMVESGSTIAGGREQTRMAFAQRLGGEDEAREYLGRVETMAAKTNYDYDEITGYAKLLLNSYDPDEALDVLQNLSDATAGLNLSSSDVNMMISGLSRMRTTGKATQEYLNYFRERGVDVDQALADELGVDKSTVSGMVSKGQVGGEDAAAAILAFIEKEFGGLSDDLAGTYDAMADNLGDLTASLEARGGDAYNELRKPANMCQAPNHKKWEDICKGAKRA